MLTLDIAALVHPTLFFVRDMVARNSGVLQVSSIGAYQPSPTYGTYSAAKAFVLSFGEALNYELRHTNVKVSVLSPGVTETEFLDVAGQQRSLFQRLSMMKSRPAAEIGINVMVAGKPSKVAGAMNALTAGVCKLHAAPPAGSDGQRRSIADRNTLIGFIHFLKEIPQEQPDRPGASGRIRQVRRRPMLAYLAPRRSRRIASTTSSAGVSTSRRGGPPQLASLKV
jgi:hypothetical protein